MLRAKVADALRAKNYADGQRIINQASHPHPTHTLLRTLRAGRSVFTAPRTVRRRGLEPNAVRHLIYYLSRWETGVYT